MVNFMTKYDKHTNDNEKRRKSIKEKEKTKSSQSQIIKQALSNSTLSNNSSKKIIFNDEDNDETQFVGTNSSAKNYNENGKTALFDGSDSETEGFEIKEKSQFSGKKGFELLNLQSTYGNDERFKIDERFIEDRKEEFNDSNNKISTDVDVDNVGEKAKQLKILESVLGTPVVSSEKEKKLKKRTNEMVRYDASNKEHEIYEINNQTETAKCLKKRKEEKRTQKTEKQELNPPKVSKQKFYEVSNEIKNSFKEIKEEGGQFSLLQTYGLNDADKDEDVEEKPEEEDVELDGDFGEYMEEGWKNYDGNRTDDYNTVTDETKVEKKAVLAQGIWKESFFFNEDDTRFKEGLEFINKKNSEEAIKAGENYDRTRKKLKEILRLHLKKQMHKRDPFRNKIGGMNKKQLGGPKSKNHRMTSNRRKPTKMNPGGRI